MKTTNVLDFSDKVFPYPFIEVNNCLVIDVSKYMLSYLQVVENICFKGVLSEYKYCLADGICEGVHFSKVEPFEISLDSLNNESYVEDMLNYFKENGLNYDESDVNDWESTLRNGGKPWWFTLDDEYMKTITLVRDGVSIDYVSDDLFMIKKELNTKELLELARNHDSTAFIEGYDERFKAREKMFEEKHKAQRPTQEFLNREYYI